MTRALILTEADLSWPSPARFARIEQCASLYSSLGLETDLVSFAPPPPSRRPVRLPAHVSRFARVNADRQQVEGGGPAARIDEGVAMLSGGERYGLVHFDEVDTDWDGLQSALRVYDACDFAGTSDEPPKADFVFAALERVRGNARFDNLPSVRLPMPCMAYASRPGTGTMVGWPGPLDYELASGWTALLPNIASKGERLAGGLMLSGKDVDPYVPPLLRRVRAEPSRYPRPVSNRVLGLGVVPAMPAMPASFDFTSLIAQGCPILTTDAVGALFEDRWQMPTCAHPEDLAEWVQKWVSGRDANDLKEGVVSTAKALFRDVEAMTAYARDSLSNLLAEDA